MGDYQLEVVVQQIQQTTTNKVEDKQPAVDHCSSTTTANSLLHYFSRGYYVHEGSGNITLMMFLLIGSSSTQAYRFAYYYFSLDCLNREIDW